MLGGLSQGLGSSIFSYLGGILAKIFLALRTKYGAAMLRWLAYNLVSPPGKFLATPLYEEPTFSN